MKFSTLLVGVASVMMLMSCNEAKRLADKLSGSWISNPQKIEMQAPYTSTSIENVVFTISDTNPKGGDILITSMISTNFPTQEFAAQGGYAATVASRAQIRGQWQAIDDDEITIALDPSTMNIVIDPDAVVLTDNSLGNPSEAKVDSIKGSMATLVNTQLTQALQMRYLALHELDDIEFHDNIMRADTARDHKITFTRQAATDN